MAQVHNRVNAGVMDGVVYGGMMEESREGFETWYRGYKAKYGSDYDHLLWLTDDIDYARSYGNRVEEVILDGAKMNVASIEETEDVGNETDEWFDYIDGPSEELALEMLRRGFSCYCFEANDDSSYCMCLWDKSVIVSRRELSREEFDKIEGYEGYDNPGYDVDLNEAAEPEDEEYEIGMEEGGPEPYAHVVNENTDYIPSLHLSCNDFDAIPFICFKKKDGDSTKAFVGAGFGLAENKKTMYITEEQLKQLKVLLEEKGESVDYNKYIKSLIDFMREQHLNIDPLPKIELNPEEQDGIFVKTGYYSPDEKKVVVFTDGRHPKDVLRTVAHEFIHHMQNLQNPNKDWGGGGDLEADGKLRSIEGEAFLLGNIIFREWTEKMKKTRELNESKKKVIRNDEGKTIPETCDKCGGKVVCQIHGEPVYVCEKCGKCFGTMPCRLNESPDHVDWVHLNYDDDDAIPFMLLRYDGRFYVGEPGETHINMMGKILGVDKQELYNSIDDDGFDDYVDLEATGRYWASKNIISFWKTPLDHLEKLTNIVNRLWKHVGFDFKNLMIDWWDDRYSSEIPYRWLVNGTFDMLNTDGNEVVKVVRRPNDIFGVLMSDGQIHNLDLNGDFVVSMYRLNEIANELVEPDEVDLSSFNIKKHLNPKFWEDGHLDTRIRLKLLDIADDFFDSLGVDWVEPEDVIITGSLANYNWSKRYSDIDLHILVDYEDVDERTDFVREYFTMKKNEWNEKHKNLKIFGFPVEVYVQDANEPHASSGVYSVDKDKWLTEPDLENLRSGHVDKKHVREMVSTYMNKIDCLVDIYKAHKDDEYEMKKVAEDAAEMMDEIKSLRKDDLSKYGKEMCDGNIIFKSLRRSDYIGKLIKLRNLAYDKINSL